MWVFVTNEEIMILTNLPYNRFYSARCKKQERNVLEDHTSQGSSQKIIRINPKTMLKNGPRKKEKQKIGKAAYNLNYNAGCK